MITDLKDLKRSLRNILNDLNQREKVEITITAEVQE